MKTLPALALLALLAAGCGANVNGPWKGTWTGAAVSGGVSLDIAQSGSSLTGVATLTGSACVSAGSLSGKVDGDKVSGSVDSGGDSWKFDGAVADGDATISGTYTFAGGNCEGQSGTFTLKK